jgi:hypothetical protein
MHALACQRVLRENRSAIVEANESISLAKRRDDLKPEQAQMYQILTEMTRILQSFGISTSQASSCFRYR